MEDYQLAQTETQAQETMKDLNVTDDDLLEAKELAASYSLEDVKRVRRSTFPLNTASLLMLGSS